MENLDKLQTRVKDIFEAIQAVGVGSFRAQEGKRSTPRAAERLGIGTQVTVAGQ